MSRKSTGQLLGHSTLGTRDSDLIARHDRRLWETAGIESKSGFWDLTAHALRENRILENDLVFRKALDFALTKADEDSNFKLETEQKSIIEAVVCQKRMCSGFYQQASASHWFFICSVSLFVVDGGRRKER